MQQCLTFIAGQKEKNLVFPGSPECKKHDIKKKKFNFRSLLLGLSERYGFSLNQCAVVKKYFLKFFDLILTTVHENANFAILGSRGLFLPIAGAQHRAQPRARF